MFRQLLYYTIENYPSVSNKTEKPDDGSHVTSVDFSTDREVLQATTRCGVLLRCHVCASPKLEPDPISKNATTLAARSNTKNVPSLDSCRMVVAGSVVVLFVVVHLTPRHDTSGRPQYATGTCEP